MFGDFIRQFKNELKISLHSSKLRNSRAGRELHSHGVTLLDYRLNSETCRILRECMDTQISSTGGHLWEDGTDKRIFGADRLCSEANSFFQSEGFFREFGWESRKVKGFSMLGKITGSENNNGSGGGWHRDSALRNQFKAIAYLSDVSAENGPFQYLSGSHASSSILYNMLSYRFTFGQYRFSEDQINEVLLRRPQLLKTFCAPVGSIMLVNTRGIHRGAPIRTGSRYAITNYYFYDENPPQHLLDLVDSGLRLTLQ